MSDEHQAFKWLPLEQAKKLSGFKDMNECFDKCEAKINSLWNIFEHCSNLSVFRFQEIIKYLYTISISELGSRNNLPLSIKLLLLN